MPTQLMPPQVKNFTAILAEQAYEMPVPGGRRPGDLLPTASPETGQLAPGVSPPCTGRAFPKGHTMRDPLDLLLLRFGNSVVGLVAVAAVCLLLWLAGALE